MNTFEFILPDDWHVHLRDGDVLANVVNQTARYFQRAIVMPNLKPPVSVVEQAIEYKTRIMSTCKYSDFNPLMTLYLRDLTTPDDIYKAKKSGIVFGCKLYPAGATTNSDAGVTDITKLDEVFSAMVDCNMPLLLHGEVTDSVVDIFDRERVFIETILTPLLNRHPDLRVVLEHITTADSVDFVLKNGDNIAATITAHHLLCNRNHMLAGGIKPHLYCLPILKTEIDRQALVKAACSGHESFFMGTDSAPHAIGAKESACGCAGCFTAPIAIPLYLEVFDSQDALDHFEAFASLNGPKFYGLKPNQSTVVYERCSTSVPDTYRFGPDLVKPFRAGKTVQWKLIDKKE